LEYASGGDLHDLLTKQGSLDHESTRFVIGEVAAALRSVHDAGFVYADLKPENILITESGHIKVTDFGACRPVTQAARDLIKTVTGGTGNAIQELRDGDWKIRSSSSSKQHNDGDEDTDTLMKTETKVEEEDDVDERIEGTTAYLPPEVAAGAIPTAAADSWALGCVLYQCISGRPPLLEETDEMTRHRIVTFHVQEEEDHTFFGYHEQSTSASSQSPAAADSSSPLFRPEAKALIRHLLCRNAEERPSLMRVADTPFFNGMDIFSLYKQRAPSLMEGTVAPAVADSKWTRRQFSSIWAPQPKTYSLGDDSHSSLSGKGTRASRQGETPEWQLPIPEGAERGSTFQPKHLSRNLVPLLEKE
jgi:serine/threonine protein kinase